MGASKNWDVRKHDAPDDGIRYCVVIPELIEDLLKGLKKKIKKMAQLRAIFIGFLVT